MGTVKSRQRCQHGTLQEAGAVLKKKHKPILLSGHDKIKACDYHSQQISDAQTVLTAQTYKMEGKHTNKEGFLHASSAQTLHPQVAGRSLYNKCVTMASQSSEMVPQSLLCNGSAHSPLCTCEGRPYRSSSFTKTRERKVADKVHYQHLNLDNHPAVTCLQNEQNLRLEGMEQRMNKIRKNAQEEAERRKYAHLFRARTDDILQTEILLKEASVALELFKQGKELKKSCEQKDLSSSVASDTVVSKHLVPSFSHHQENDKGDIIPVHIVLNKPGSSNKMSQEKQFSSKAEKPLMWLLQPVEAFHLSKFLFYFCSAHLFLTCLRKCESTCSDQCFKTFDQPAGLLSDHPSKEKASTL